MKRRITQLSAVLLCARGACIAILAALIMSMLVGCGPSDPIQEVREQIATGDLEGSLDSMRELLTEDPENLELLFLYGQVLVKTGQPGLAEWPLRKVMQDPLWFERAAKLLASVEIAGGNFANAAEIYARVLEVNPDDLQTRINRANACAKTPALFEEALAEVDRILESAPDELGAYKPRILAYLGLNKPEEAGKAIEELGVRIDEDVTEDNPIRGWHCATMAIFAADSGDMERAREQWAGCEEKFPTHPNVVAQSIEFHKRQGDVEGALRVAQAAFAAEPAEGAGYRLITAELLREAGRGDEAESLLLEGAEESDDVLNQAAALLALTEHYKSVGDSQAAAETLERALVITQRSIGPQPDLLFALADLLILIGDGDRALELSERMSVTAHRSLIQARVAHDRKQYAKALKLYAETSRLWPENPYAPYHEARAAMSAGLFDRAFKSYLLSIRVDENATDARYQAARLMMAEGQLGSAIEMLGSTQAAPALANDLLAVELAARTRGPVAGTNAANRMSQRRPAHFGEAIAAAARGASEGTGDSAGAWAILEPLLGLDFPPANLFPILQAAVTYAPGAKELAVVEPLVEGAVESHPDSPHAREMEGMLFERSNERAKAEASYRLALVSEPNRTTALLRLARIVAPTQPEEAMAMLQQAMQQQAASPSAFESDLLLAAVAELPASREAASLLESALELDPLNGQIAYRLATWLETNGGAPERVARLAARAVRFQAGDEAVELRDRLRERT